MRKIYKILLVDDEDDIRGRISSKISESIGFEIVGSAGNGFDALDFLESNDVDVVLTDIKMPFIDGIELTKIVKREYPMIKVAFITGYDDFDYAKEAIDLGVKRYMTKPITSNEINQFLKSLKLDLDNEYNQMHDIMIIKEKYEKLLPVIGDSYLSSLLYVDRIKLHDIEKLKLYEIDVLPYKSFYTFLIRLDEEKHGNLKQIEHMRVNVNEIIKKIFSISPFRHNLIVSEGIVCVFAVEDLKRENIDDLLNQLSHSVKEYLGVDVYIGVSNEFTDFTLFPNSYQEARRAINYTNLHSFAHVVYMDELFQNQVKQSFIRINDYNNFSRIMQYGTHEELKELIEELRKRIMNHQTFFVKEYVIVDLSSLLINLSDQAGASIDEVIGYNIVKELRKYKQYDLMLKFVYDLMVKIKEVDSRKQLSHNDRLIKRMTEYISSNYSNPDLSLEYLGDLYNLSTPHLSMLFKQGNGLPFSKYLINLRISKAKTLLIETELKIANISVEVGYKDVYYFSHSFKKVTGFSPKEFRLNETNQN